METTDAKDNNVRICYMQSGHYYCLECVTVRWLWSPYVLRQTIIFSSCFFLLLLSSFFSSLNLSDRRLDVYHTLAHGVALVRI